MKYIVLLFLCSLLLSCSKQNRFVENNKIEPNIVIEIFDNESLNEDYSTKTENITEIDYRDKLMKFIEKPFLNDNVIYPFLNGYVNFDELYNHLGIPISEYEIIKGIPELIMDSENYAKNIIFEHYSIWALYIASEKTVCIYQISIEVENDVLYNYNIKKHDSPENIFEIFGDPFKIGKTGNTKINHFNYFFGFDYPQIGFSFEEERLWRIVFSFMADG
jgi:hypothetical protein